MWSHRLSEKSQGFGENGLQIEEKKKVLFRLNLHWILVIHHHQPPSPSEKIKQKLFKILIAASEYCEDITALVTAKCYETHLIDNKTDGLY